MSTPSCTIHADSPFPLELGISWHNLSCLVVTSASGCNQKQGAESTTAIWLLCLCQRYIFHLGYAVTRNLLDIKSWIVLEAEVQVSPYLNQMRTPVPTAVHILQAAKGPFHGSQPKKSWLLFSCSVIGVTETLGWEVGIAWPYPVCIYILQLSFSHLPLDVVLQLPWPAGNIFLFTYLPPGSYFFHQC